MHMTHTSSIWLTLVTLNVESMKIVVSLFLITRYNQPNKLYYDKWSSVLKPQVNRLYRFKNSYTWFCTQLTWKLKLVVCSCVGWLLIWPNSITTRLDAISYSTLHCMHSNNMLVLCVLELILCISWLDMRPYNAVCYQNWSYGNP